MNRRFIIVIAVLAALMSGCQLPGGKSSGAKDGYFTWVDEQGRVRQTKIPSSSSKPQSETVEVIVQAQKTRDQEQQNADDASVAKAPRPQDEEYNLENYPDGNKLAEQGFLRPGDPEPYFTWKDAQGNVRVSYYRPDTRTAVEKGEIQPPLKLTRASIYQESDVSSGEVQLPEGADPLAAEVLGLDSSLTPFFERWRRTCCDALDRGHSVDWEMGREFGVTVTPVSPSHDFLTGQSRYRLVKLPPGPGTARVDQNLEAPTTRDFILRLRSFNQKGMFVPSVAFLDDQFQPVRLVTDLVAEFIPESWSRHGHIRSYIPVFPSRGERWMLIFTTAADLNDQTVIETRFGPRAIPHQNTGELGLSRVEQ